MPGKYMAEKQMKRKNLVLRSAVTVLAGLLSALLLCSCVGPQYKPEDEKALRETGERMMQEWLDAHLPGEKVTGAEVYIDVVPSGPQRLTDYVKGSYTDHGESLEFLIDTVNGEVFTSKGAEEFQDPAWDYLLELLDMDPQTPRLGRADNALADFWASLYLPSLPEGSGRKLFHDHYSMPLVPAELVYGGTDTGGDGLAERFAAFLREPGRGQKISFTADLKLPDEFPVGRFTPGGLMRMLDTDGVYFEWIRIRNTDEELWHYGWSGEYTRWGMIDLGDFRIRAELDYISDKRNKDSEQGFDRSETHADPASFRPVRKTEDGYEVRYPEEMEYWPRFYIIAGPGSEIMKYEYEIPGDEKDEPARPCLWESRGDGSFLLANSEGYTLTFGYNEDLKIRGERDPALNEAQAGQ